MARGIENSAGHTVLWCDTPQGRQHLDANKVMLRASDACVLIADRGSLRLPTDAEYDMAELLPMVQQHGLLKVGG